MNMFPSLYSGFYDRMNQNPYGYGSSDEMPTAMEGLTNRLPPLYPSMETPQSYPPSPFPNYNLAQARYATGGYVDGGDYEEQNPLSYITDLLRQAGQREDSVLAHINPEEAQELGEKYGYDYNPLTGLPQYGKFKLKKIKHLGKQVVRHGLPIAGSVVGAIYGGPMGASVGGAAGGALGNALTGRSSSKELLGGAFKGGLQGYFSGPAFAQGGKGLFAQGIPGLTSGLSSGFNSSLSGLGLAGTQSSALPRVGGTSSGMGLTNSMSAVPKGMPNFIGKGPFGFGAGSLMKGTAAAAQGAAGGGGSNMLDKLLLGSAVLGTLMRKEKTKKDPFSFYQDQLQNEMAQRKVEDVRRQEAMRNVGPLQRQVKMPPLGYRGGYDPEWDYFPDEQGYRKGGYIDGDTGGQDDDVHMDIPEGAFVLDANTVAQLGDGNNKAGRTKLDKMFGGINKFSHPAEVKRSVKAAVSNGEYIVYPAGVNKVGNGNNKAGAHELKQMVNNIRNHKGFKGFPPKAKPLNQYLTSKSRRR